MALKFISRTFGTPDTLGLVNAFLVGRKMSVKIGSTYSEPQLVPGGSPQGSILGNYLFCATTNHLTQEIQYNTQITPDDLQLDGTSELNGTTFLGAEEDRGDAGAVGDGRNAGSVHDPALSEVREAEFISHHLICFFFSFDFPLL